MAETMNYSVGNRFGCGFMNAFFQNRFFGQRRSPQRPLLPSNEKNPTKPQSTINNSVTKPLPRIDEKPRINPVSISQTRSLRSSRKKPLVSARSSTSSSSNSSGLQRESLTRASSENILISSSKSIKAMNLETRNGANINTGNILRKKSGEMSQFGNIIRGINNLNPEVVKNMGNEKYKMGRFGEALALYNQAIAIDPNKATYYSNKGAALIGLGRLAEAVFACEVAVKIEPSYHRAHYRLATLYFRMGEAEKAEYHYKLSGLDVASDEIDKSRALKQHIHACKMSMELKDWDSMLKESQHAVSLGADSAPQISAMKIDALLNLRKHKEAYESLEKGPQLDMDSCSRLFGGARSAYILAIRAQVYMTIGRYEDAVSAAHQAIRQDKRHKTNPILKRVEAVVLARSNGNHLFKASKYPEAIVTYSEGLQLDPYNSNLLCNRAACKFKLGQFEKAIDDCTVALNVRPCYNKARLRRANCYAKMGKWDAAIIDYEMLVRDAPEDEELAKYLYEAKAQIKSKNFEDTIKLRIKRTNGEDTRH